MATAQKLDLFKMHAAEYVAPRAPALVATKPGRYLTISGTGDPAGPAFAEKVAALYAAAFTIKMMKKERAGIDYKVAGLEGLWWAPGRGPEMMARPRDEWRWKLLIRVPGCVTARCVALASKALLAKGKGKDVRSVKLETITEGRCVQMLHVGPYAAEGTTVGRMQEFAASQGLRLAGKHHEIYLSDPRRVPPERLRTILRHPVR
jgi:hypothetical protein